MANKYLALQKDVFDISKVTVVGSPTITSDGVASGFSDSNYISILDSIKSLNKPFTIKCDFVYKSNSKNQDLFGLMQNSYQNMIRALIKNNGVLSFEIFLNGTSTSINSNLSLVHGEKYTLECGQSIDNTMFLKYRKANDNNWVEAKSANKDLVNFSQLTVARIGNGAHTTGEPFNGSINLTAFKIYVDNQLIYSPTKPTYLLERRKPTVWNKGQFTIVGSPTISDSGVASGFSVGNYVKFPNIDLSTANSFDIISPVFYGYQKNSEQLIVGITSSDITFKLIIVYNNYLGVRLKTSSSSTEQYKYSKIIVEDGQQYQIRVTFDGTQYKFYVRNISDDWGEPYSTYNSTEKISTNDSCTYSIGGPNAGYVYSGQGIDLKQFKIYTDNNLVFDGGADTYVYDPSKFTIVGSPTITEYGVASGFSSSDYVTFPISVNNNFEIIVNFKSVFGSIEQRIWTCVGNESTPNYFTLVQTTDNILQLRVPTNTNSFFVSVFEYNITDNENIWVKLKISGNSAQGFISNDGINWYLKGDVVTYNDLASLQVSRIDIGALNTFYALGSINLPSISITVDGKEVFTGAKENYYMLRR